MKEKDLLMITTVALGTAALTVAGFLGSPLEAGSEPTALVDAIATPKLTAAGIEMSLAPAGGREFKAGDQPAFELRAVNTLDRPSSATVRLTMTATAPADRLSRVLLMPAVLWQEQRALTLGPNETKVFTFNARTNLPASSSISVSLSEVDGLPQTAAADHPERSTVSPLPLLSGPGIVALSFSTVTPAAGPALALN
jgi:hypothetical protein